MRGFCLALTNLGFSIRYYSRSMTGWLGLYPATSCPGLSASTSWRIQAQVDIIFESDKT